MSTRLVRGLAPSVGYEASIWPQVAYEYFVADKQYRGKNIRPGGGVPITYLRLPFSYLGSPFYGKVENPYKEGDVVTVYFDPAHPEQSALEPGFHLKNIAETIFWILLLTMFCAKIFSIRI